MLSAGEQPLAKLLTALMWSGQPTRPTVYTQSLLSGKGGGLLLPGQAMGVPTAIPYVE
jgi:hypothetical protein